MVHRASGDNRPGFRKLQCSHRITVSAYPYHFPGVEDAIPMMVIVCIDLDQLWMWLWFALSGSVDSPSRVGYDLSMWPYVTLSHSYRTHDFQFRISIKWKKWGTPLPSSPPPRYAVVTRQNVSRQHFRSRSCWLRGFLLRLWDPYNAGVCLLLSVSFRQTCIQVPGEQFWRGLWPRYSLSSRSSCLC